MTVIFYVYLAIMGLAVGSFLNVVIVRMPAKESIFRPRSKCPQCGHEISGRDNIPVISWLLLKGKCRSCDEPIAAGYPLVELSNMILWLAAAVKFGEHWILIPYLVLFSALLAQSVIDFELFLLLDRITFPVLFVSIPMLVAAAFLSRHTDIVANDPKGALIGAAIGSIGSGLFLGLLALISPRGMGLGDVKLCLLTGLYLGFIDPILPLFALPIGSLFGMVPAAIQYFRRGRKSEEFAFGPWLALGCVVCVLFHTSILSPFRLN